MTSHSVWQSTTGSSPSESYTYDTTGSPVSYTDFGGNPTVFTYSDGAHVAPNKVTNALHQFQQYTYDQGTLKLTQSIDPNSVTSVYLYNDPLDRLTTVKNAFLTPGESWTSFSYPNTTTVSTYQDQNTENDGAIRVDTLYDGLGRQTSVNQYESSSQYISTATTYDALWRVHTTANPSRPNDGLNYLTTYGYDALGRTVSVQTADNSTTTLTPSFNATTLQDQVDVTDPAGSTRRRMTDGLGRLRQVVEDPSGLNNSTTYSYDALDNVKMVTQGSQTRTFNYDSLSHLTSATNPENGTITYPLYDNNGNLKQQTLGGVTTNYSYDPLNRITLISYSGVSTPTVTYCYDGQIANGDASCVASSVANGIGRLTQVHTSVSTTSYAGYDPLGRITASTQTTGQGYSFQYRYDLSGALTQETYPSGRTVMNGYDAAGRLCSVSGTTSMSPPAPPYACSGSGGTVYASSIQYAPQGSVTTLVRGDAQTETWSYNSRMQPQNIAVGSAFGLSLYYCAGKASSCSTNNGNLLTATPSTTDLDQTATYDKANRLASFAESANQQSYGYDPPGNGWANRWVSLNSGALPLSGYMPVTSSGYNSQNQIAAAQYNDGRGNMTGLGTWSYSYDGENRLIAAQSGSSGGAYGYDGNGLRVTKTVGTQTTTYVYDAMGNLAGEYGNPVTAPCTTCYVSVDQLGSTRVLTDAQGNVKERHDYMPFGDELLAGVGGRTNTQGYLSSGSTPGTSVLFTGQYRDTELANSQMPSGLDYFGARHHAPAFGRFMQTDPAGSIVADPRDPQSWHLYNYVGNNPLNYTDPSGLQSLGLGDCADDPSCGLDWSWYGGWFGDGGNSSGPPQEPSTHPNPTLPSGIPNTTGIYGSDSTSGGAASCNPPFCFNATDPNAIEEHHVLIQALRAWFAARGIDDIDKFLISLPAGLHRLKAFGGIHTGENSWNAEWMRFKNAFPNATPKEIFDFARQLVKKFKIDGFPGGSAFDPLPTIFIDTCKLNPYQPVCLNRRSSGPVY